MLTGTLDTAHSIDSKSIHCSTDFVAVLLVILSIIILITFIIIIIICYFSMSNSCEEQFVVSSDTLCQKC